VKKIELDDLVRDAKKDLPEVDWKSVDEKLFARLEREPRPLPVEDETHAPGARVLWVGAAFALAAAAAALVFVHPARESVDPQASLAQPAGELVHGDVAIGATSSARDGTQLARGDRIDVVDDVAYFQSPGKVRWAAPRGSVLRVEHEASPLVLSLEQGAAEAQVTPVPSGEAFAIDVTSSSGSVVRVAVHGTHLRVARSGDHVTIDLTEGVVSIGAPPRRGSTIGTLVTAPAHVELDARDPSSVRVDHEPSSVRPAERVSPAPLEHEVASLAPPPPLGRGELLEPQEHETVHAPTLASAHKSTAPVENVESVQPPAPTWLTTSAELASALARCTGSLPAGMTFSTTLSLRVGDDGTVKRAIFRPAMPPDARDCTANVIYKRSKLAPGDVTIPITIGPR
jgi:hypothetical protein